VRTIVTIPISQIDHGDLPINKKALTFALEMKIGKHIFPPVPVERLSNGRFKLCDGRHRLAAHKLIGRNEIRASVAAERPIKVTESCGNVFQDIGFPPDEAATMLAAADAQNVLCGSCGIRTCLCFEV
jgi:hypothetical protein